MCDSSAGLTETLPTVSAVTQSSASGLASTIGDSSATSSPLNPAPSQGKEDDKNNGKGTGDAATGGPATTSFSPVSAGLPSSVTSYGTAASSSKKTDNGSGNDDSDGKLTAAATGGPATTSFSPAAASSKNMKNEALEDESASSAAWWSMVSSNFKGKNLSTCADRNDIPPEHGSSCSNKIKTCFFGTMTCPSGQNPATRCYCDGKLGSKKWSCSTMTCEMDWD